jgi:predicted ATPase
VQPHFSIEKEMDMVARICRALEGLPLAPEMAAVWSSLDQNEQAGFQRLSVFRGDFTSAREHLIEEPKQTRIITR